MTTKKLTWDELATIYDKTTGNHARTMEMDAVFDWAVGQPDKFIVDENDILCLIISDTDNHASAP